MKNKNRFLKVLEYLKNYTDENHLANANDIIEYLQSEDIYVERKTIYNDIAVLNDLGYEVETSKKGYYYSGQQFSSAELRILLDSIEASSFITVKKTTELTEKLLSLTNEFERKKLAQGVYSGNKAENEQILYNIDSLLEAIVEKKAVTFKYFDLDVNDKKKYRNHNYKVYPYSLVISGNRYYLVCSSVNHQSMTNYRIDKMEKVELTEERYEKVPVDIEEYKNRTFSMFNGEIKNIVLKCTNDIYDLVKMNFGTKNMIVTKKEYDYFLCNVNVAQSPSFYSWIFTYGGKIEIVSPEDVKQGFIEQCNNILNKYK